MIQWSPIGLPLIAIYVYGFMALTQGICGCDFSEDIPGLVVNSSGMNLSTAWMRHYTDKNICPANVTPCYVYATLPENALNEVFINFHVNLAACKKEVCHPTFKYAEGKVDNKHNDFFDWEEAEVIKADYETPATEYSRRGVYSVILKNLNASSDYSFVVTDSDWDNSNAQIYTYHTFDTSNMTIAAGGDIGNSKLAHEMMDNTISKFPVDLIMVGGDIAYDQNSPHCFRAYDYLMQSFPVSLLDENTKTIRIVPVLFSTGNHDLGATSFTPVEIKHTPHEPLFKHFYPQNTANGKIPNLFEREYYFSQSIGDDVLILNLDTAYAGPMKGEQTEWIKEQLSNSKHKIKLAQFHGPIYTACVQDKVGDFRVQDDGLEAWVPLFDEYNMTIVFENHSHVFKRSKLIKHGVEDSQGTLYLGEGSWGVASDIKDCVRQNEELMETVMGVASAWIVNIDVNKGIDSQAFDNMGMMIDRYYLPL
eukprot:CAMPEP_0205819172 /NCGR_PEP_ID=MMETSP0206-20130828/1431_1 /ASSEMBLY_ACC=CAM_ASM_000279 /TAXON_ID=36767 /ORGANISM="Euplotes focardii, Strain TN1" /LENGTH=477 /DNA_ID=CAMNT_0053112435 /DNA_START=500 /DNA_END=1933 /DNA_ORIENTATION=-